ncbi:MAG: hypothetical protein ACTTKH_02095 [Treponema sp.]
MKALEFRIVFSLFFVLFLFSCSNKKEEDVVRIVFYQVPSTKTGAIENILKKQFEPSSDEKIELKFEQVNDANKLKEMVEKDKNISLIFSNTAHLPFATEKAAPFDVSLYGTFPSCIKRYAFERLEKNAEGSITLPILLDSYNLFFNNTILEKKHVIGAYDVGVFSKLLEELSTQSKYPILCAGGEDATLLFFVSNVMQMVGDVYSIHDEKIKEVNLKNRGAVFNDALELIVQWQKKGFLHPEWFRLKNIDISLFMDLKEIGVLFTPMSEYNEVKSEARQFYSLMPNMPLSDACSLNGLSVSVLSLVKPIQKEENKSIAKNEYISKIIEYCISVEGQKELSDITGFSSASMSNINQSSTSSIRYILATVSVVLEDVGTIVLEDSSDASFLATEIRQYFQANGVGY